MIELLYLVATISAGTALLFIPVFITFLNVGLLPPPPAEHWAGKFLLIPRRALGHNGNASASRLPNTERVSVNSVVRKLSTKLREQVGEGTELFTELDPALEHMSGNPAEIEEAATNLIRHAREAMPQGGRVVVATKYVELMHEPDYPRRGSEARILLTVSGADADLPAELLRKIFEQYYQGGGRLPRKQGAMCRYIAAIPISASLDREVLESESH